MTKKQWLKCPQSVTPDHLAIIRKMAGEGSTDPVIARALGLKDYEIWLARKANGIPAGKPLPPPRPPEARYERPGTERDSAARHWSALGVLFEDDPSAVASEGFMRARPTPIGQANASSLVGLDGAA